MPSKRGKYGGTSYYQEMIGINEEGNTPFLKGRSGVVFLYAILKSVPLFSLHNLGFRAITDVWDLIT